MEPLAQKKIKTAAGEVTVRAFTFEDLTTLSNSAVKTLATLSEAEGEQGSAVLSMGSAVIEGVKEILLLCTSLKINELKKLPAIDLVTLFEAWLDVSKWEETSKLFFGVVDRVKNVVPNTPKKATET